MADTRWLEKRRQGWYATVYVPLPLRDKLGRKLSRSLRTRDLREAQTKRHLVVAEFKRIIADAHRPADGRVALEAMNLRESMAQAEAGQTVIHGYGRDHEGTEPGQREQLQGYIADRAEQIAERHGDTAAAEFYGIAIGTATPLLLHLNEWLDEGGVRGPYQPRTKAQIARDITELSEWLAEASVPVTIEAVSRRIAARFVTEHLSKSGRTPKTVSRILSSCRSYWVWLARRALAGDVNPWDRQAPPKAARSGHEDERERPFTDAEMATLLTADTDAELADLTRVAALSGMRLDEIYRLTVKDCAGGTFSIRRAKTKAGVRIVPIHSAIAAIVAKRTAGKKQDDYLFHEAGGAPKEGRERSMPASKRFGRLLRRLGLAVIVPGKRRSLVNAHSLRRWFITAAIRAGQPEHVVQQVVGHKAQGVTLGVYFGGDLPATLRACVEAVKLPLVAG